MPASLEVEARALLARMTGAPGCEFRPGQFEAISTLVEGRGRVLVVQRTGWGKSAVYFTATRLLRDRGAGPTLLVSPLLALMRNQIEMARRAGVRAATINSDNRDDWDAVEREVRKGRVDVLLVSPERLSNPHFRSEVLPDLVSETGLFVIDEAHCISDWGHDFRPDYRRVARVLDLLPSSVPVLCTTATANQRVIDDVVEQLGDDLVVLRGTLARESLALSVLHIPDPAQRLVWLADHLPGLPGAGIVYCLTVRDTLLVADWLRRQGIDAVAYSGETDSERRVEIEDALTAGRVKAVVATSALGMGYDKPDLGWVVHYQGPGSPVAYYQQVGRAGRAVARADGVLVVGGEDGDIQDFFIRTAFPPRHQAEAVVDLLARRAEPVKEKEILGSVNIRPSRLQNMLKVLDVEGAVERLPSARWLRTLQPWAYDQERVDRVTAARRAEQAAMLEYATTAECLMAFLQGQLDDPRPAPCGRCANCTGRHPVVATDPAAVAEAREFIRAMPLVIRPRSQWGNNFPGLPFTIPPSLRLEEGRALCAYGDGGWGGLVRDDKHKAGVFRDELVEASARLIAAWAPDPRPTWVTAVPSRRHPDLVPGFARRLAAQLGLPFVEAVARLRDDPPQKEMENSAQQLRNVYGAFSVNPALPGGPVLLVDDLYDSKWTFTVVGALLREAGAGLVYPYALAEALST